jgi:hypothetical protein
MTLSRVRYVSNKPTPTIQRLSDLRSTLTLKNGPGYLVDNVNLTVAVWSATSVDRGKQTKDGC